MAKKPKFKPFHFTLQDLVNAAETALDNKKLQFQNKAACSGGCAYGSGKNNSINCIVGSVLPAELIQRIQDKGDEGTSFSDLISKKYIKVTNKQQRKFMDYLQSMHDSLTSDGRPMRIREAEMRGAISLASNFA